MSVIISIYSSYFVCQNPSDNIFTNFECVNEPRMAALYVCALSSGYCFYDIYVCIYEIEFTPKECRDYIFHHAVGVFGAILVLINGQFFVLLSVANLISESSNFLMNIRWRLLKLKMTESWMFFASSVAFMVVFFWSRVFFMFKVTLRFY